MNDIKELKQFIQEMQTRSTEGLRQHIDNGFSRSEERFDKIDRRFGKVNEHFEKINERFQKIDEHFDKIESSVNELRKEMRQGFLGVGEAIDLLGEDIDKRFAEHEGRITQLEQQAV